MKRVYLDHAATTPLLDVAREAMEPWLDCGNPSSNHAEGRRAKLALDEAREVFAQAYACDFAEVVFTGSATEAANLALVGLSLANESGRRRFLVSAAEHKCVLETAPMLCRLGYSFETVPVKADSSVDVDALMALSNSETLAVVAMAANNESGVWNCQSEVSRVAQAVGAATVCDLCQGFPGPVELEFVDVGFCAPHKFGGPKGVGAMFIRSPWKLKALVAGGGQERELRGGTENVAAVVGAAAALQWNLANLDRVQKAKSDAADAFLTALGPHQRAVAQGDTLPGFAHLWFEGCEADALLIRLDRAGIAASSGAACTSGSVEPSHVVMEAGFDEKRARECLRFTFGWTTTVDEAAWAGAVVRREVDAMRSSLQPA